MTVRLYRFDDVGAPVLTGQVGTLVALLDAVLVDGYGSQPAAGWSIAQTTTNKRGYKQGAGGNHPSGIHFYVDDTGPGIGGAREARCCGFETMSAITPVGTGQFPNSTQSPIGSGFLVIRKSNTNDSTPRRWFIVADAHTFYISIEHGDGGEGPVLGNMTAFGDFDSFKPGDAYAQILIGRTGENTADGRYEAFGGVFRGNDAHTVNDNIAGHFFSRHWNQLAVAVRGGKYTPALSIMAGDRGTAFWVGNNTQLGGNQDAGPGMGYRSQDAANFPFPNPVDGSLWMGPLWLIQNGIRGALKGVYAPAHVYPLNPGDTFTVASGNLSGKSFIALHSSCATNETRQRAIQYFIEFSDTW
jgi:hypothetical protein